MEHLILVGFGVIGVTQIAKMLGVSSRFLPLIAGLLGIALSLAVAPPTVTNGILGLVEGLSVTGFVNFAKEMKKTPVLSTVVNQVSTEVPAPPVTPAK